MTTAPVTFPQSSTKPAKKPRTIASILEQTAGMSPSQIMALIRAAFPQATDAEIAHALDECAERLEAEAGELDGEAQAMAEIAALCAPVFKSGEAETVGDALKILSDRGDKRAAAYLAQLKGPGQQEFDHLLDLAVDEDPYWSKSADGRSYTVKPGARYTTPEELVAGYKRNHALG